MTVLVLWFYKTKTVKRRWGVPPSKRLLMYELVTSSLTGLMNLTSISGENIKPLFERQLSRKATTWHVGRTVAFLSCSSNNVQHLESNCWIFCINNPFKIKWLCISWQATSFLIESNRVSKSISASGTTNVILRKESPQPLWIISVESTYLDPLCIKASRWLLNTILRNFQLALLFTIYLKAMFA